MKLQNSPITFKKVKVTSRFAAQLKQLVNANALPLTAAGNISLRRSHVTDPKKKQKQKKRYDNPQVKIVMEVKLCLTNTQKLFKL